MFVERLEKRFQRFGKYYLHLASCRDDAACASIKTLGKGKNLFRVSYQPADINIASTTIQT